MGERPEKDGRYAELVGDQNPGPEASPRSKRGEGKGDVRRGATARKAIEKSRYVRAIEEVRGDDPIKYLLPTEVRKTFRIPERVMVVTIPQNEEICGGGKNGGRKRVGSAISRKRMNRESINIWE